MMLQSLALCAASVAVAHAAGPGFSGGFKNSGTPNGIPPKTDCAIRKFAWEQGKALMPRRGNFLTLYDALQLGPCGVPKPTTPIDEWEPPSFPVPSSNAVFADPTKGKDTNAGTAAAPVASIVKAIALSKAQGTVVLRAGTYHIGANTVQITAAQSGLTIQNYPGERAIVSGGEDIPISKSMWTASAPFPGTGTGGNVWTDEMGVNNVQNEAAVNSSTNIIKFFGKIESFALCKEQVHRSAFNCTSLTWHSASFVAPYTKNCYCRVDGVWKPQAQAGIDSSSPPHSAAGYGCKANKCKIYEADLSKLPGGKPKKFDGLRIGLNRAIRAKFPNGDPERSGEDYIMGASQAMGGGAYAKGWVEDATTWTPHSPSQTPHTEVNIVADDWPGVHWPMTHRGDLPGQPSRWTGEGDWGVFHAGIGGTCDDVTPPFGYWCAKKPPRGISQHWSPSGFTWKTLLARGANYTKPEDAVVVGWRGGGRWYTWIWSVDSWDAAAGTAAFTPGTGNQGGEGEDSAAQWYVENIKEELDSPTEWYYDAEVGKLYYAFNGTDGAPTGNEKWSIARTKTLFNISGTQAAPVTDVTLRGLAFRDAALTWLDPHGLPSGGDWALQRSGAINLVGTERVTINASLVERVDGNGIYLGDYNRNATIANSEFAWNGATCIGSWGYTRACLNANCTLKLPWGDTPGGGPDARNGRYPSGTRILNNLFREVGIFQKQASAYFHANSAKAEVAGNVIFNGPRAMMNFNDGMVGGDEVHANLLANAVRESGDHSAINSWDRMPYIHEVDGKPTVIPYTRREHHNLILGTYSTQEAFDTDDGSSYYAMYNNFLAYGSNGLKSDFGGHDHSSIGDVYAYVANCFGNGNYLSFINSTCILNFQPDATMDGKGYSSDCNLNPGMVVEGNTVATPGGSMYACGQFLDTWVASAKSKDKGTKSVRWPTDKELSALGKATLASDPVWDGGAKM